MGATHYIMVTVEVVRLADPLACTYKATEESGMTDQEQAQMRARKRQAYARRLRDVREGTGHLKATKLPPLSGHQREALLDLLMRVEGDGVTDPDLYVLHRLANRGLVG